MHVVYHSLGSVETGYGETRETGYPEALREHLDAVSRPGTAADLRGTTHGGIADSYRFFADLDTCDVLKNLLRIRNEDVDAVAIGNIFDPGLRAGREVLTIPVTGQLETSVLAGCFVADRLGIVSINNKQAAHSRDKLRTYQLTDRVTMSGLPVDISELSAAYGDRETRATVFEAFETAARECVADGAEYLVPGGGILSVLLTEFDLQSVDGVPVMDQVAVQVRLTETLVDLYDIGALETSGDGTFAGLAPERVDELQAEYGID